MDTGSTRLERISTLITRKSSNLQNQNEKLIIKKFESTFELILNRPNQLNAIDSEMINKIKNEAKILKQSPNFSVLLFRGTGNFSFTAGGDLVSSFKNASKDINLKPDPTNFFNLVYDIEQTRNELCNIPQVGVGIWDGITIGAGIILTDNFFFKIATENTKYSMPEVKIGSFTQMGHIFPKMKNKLGYYIGITAASLNGKDVVRAGLATHFVPSNKIPFLLSEIYQIQTKEERETKLKIQYILSKYEEKVYGPTSFENETKQLFEGNSIEEIISNLKNSKSLFAKKCLKMIELNNKLAMKLTFEYYKKCEKLSRGEIQELDYIIMEK